MISIIVALLIDSAEYRCTRWIWWWADGVDKDATEAALAAQIELQKKPVVAAGVPWAA